MSIRQSEVDSGADQALVETLQGLVDGLASRRKIPHAVLGVARGDGSWRWIGAAGTARADGTPMRPETPYLVASVTKLYIATVVLRLYEEGQVDLDAPMSSYLPGGLIAGLHVLEDVDYTPKVTVRHLLSHTSGLPDYLEDTPRGGSSMYRSLAGGTDMSWTVDDMVRTAREMPPHFAPQNMRAPRQKARYSDTNFQLLLALIGEVGGGPFHEVFEKHLFRPLDLGHTWFPGRSRPLHPLDHEPAALWSKDRALDIPQALASFNDLISTADDTLRFLTVLTRGEVFANPATYRMMQERWNRVIPGSPIRYRLGTMRFRIPSLFAPGRQAINLVGHSGATGSWLFHCPELDLLLTGTVDEIGSRALPFRFLPKVLRAMHRPGAVQEQPVSVSPFF